MSVNKVSSFYMSDIQKSSSHLLYENKKNKNEDFLVKYK